MCEGAITPLVHRAWLGAGMWWIMSPSEDVLHELREHTEVGSRFIHFNFTPRGQSGDKATPSLIGDVARGVLRLGSIFAKFWRCCARPSLSSSFDCSIGAQSCFGIDRQLAFLYLVDAFYCSCFCNQRPCYREWARLFLSGAGERLCA